MVRQTRRFVEPERLIATLVAGGLVLAGWRLLTGGGSGSGPVGLVLWGVGQLLFLRFVADGACPRTPIGVKRTAHLLAGTAVLLALVWWGWSLARPGAG